MKKVYAFVLAISVILSLTACSSTDIPSTYSVTIDNTEYSVDNGDTINSDNDGTYDFAGIISDSENTYDYVFYGTSTEYSVDITYPDGSTYHLNQQPGAGSANWSDDYDAENYVDGDVLCQVIDQQFSNVDDKPSNILIIVFLMILGLISLIFPQFVWYISHGWRFKNVEPSDITLILNRVAGAIFIIIAVIMIII